MLYSKRGAHSACECRDCVASHDSSGRLAAGHGGEDEIFDATADLPAQRLRDPAPTTHVNRLFFVTRGSRRKVRQREYEGLPYCVPSFVEGCHFDVLRTTSCATIVWNSSIIRMASSAVTQ